MLTKLERYPGEDNLAYHKRMVYGKLVDKTLADCDYTELAEAVYGQAYSSDVARRMMYGSCRTLQLVDAALQNTAGDADLLSKLEEKKIELQKERQKFFDQRQALNKIIRERAQQEELNEILVSAVCNGSLPALQYQPASIEQSDNDLLVSLNDIHYGAKVTNYWNTYDADICREMLCQYINQILPIAKRHKSERCIVWANGDLISGSIHYAISVTNRENIIEQVTGVSELIAEFLAALSQHFSAVQFVSVAGNHSRLDTKDRALKDERLDDLAEWYIKARLQNFENIEIGVGKKIDATMYLLDVRGRAYVGVHGDYDGSGEKIQALQKMAGTGVYAVLSGHLHHNKIDTVQGIKTIMAGSFVGMDDYCVAKRIYGQPEQLVCVCDAGGVQCAYDIKFNHKQ